MQMVGYIFVAWIPSVSLTSNHAGSFASYRSLFVLLEQHNWDWVITKEQQFILSHLNVHVLLL